MEPDPGNAGVGKHCEADTWFVVSAFLLGEKEKHDCTEEWEWRGA